MKRLSLAAALVVLGWTLGRAQTTTPDFSMAIDTPAGTTTVRCERGCRLQGGHDEGNRLNTPMTEYRFRCTGSDRCRATVNGWLASSR
jgi:hypothetical protein